MNNRYNELDNNLKTSIDVLIDCLASCQNETQNEKIFNEIIKDAFVKINKNHSDYLRYKEIETNKLQKEIDKINRNINHIVNNNIGKNTQNKKQLIFHCFERIQEIEKEIETL